jgi:hypothetical protein
MPSEQAFQEETAPEEAAYLLIGVALKVTQTLDNA